MRFDSKENQADIVENDRKKSAERTFSENDLLERMISGKRKQLFSVNEKNRIQWQKEHYHDTGDPCVTVRWNRTEEEQSQTIFYLS